MPEKVGVFDSGIGGLTVLKALRKAYPGLDIVYLGDLARVPYGGRSAKTIIKYACEDADFLLRQGVSTVISACNTVSAAALDVLKTKLDVPVYGVIDSAARQAAERSRSGVVGVIGTQATIQSGAYEKRIRQLRPDCVVLSQACPLFVPLIEQGIYPEDPIAALVCERYLRSFIGKDVDTLIMGCTHYPVYESLLRRMLPGVQLINTGEALAEELQSRYGACREGCGHVEYFVTERSAAFDETLRIMDNSVDPSAIHVDDSFI